MLLCAFHAPRVDLFCANLPTPPRLRFSRIVSFYHGVQQYGQRLRKWVFCAHLLTKREVEFEARPRLTPKCETTTPIWPIGQMGLYHTHNPDRPLNRGSAQARREINGPAAPTPTLPTRILDPSNWWTLPDWRSHIPTQSYRDPKATGLSPPHPKCHSPIPSQEHRTTRTAPPKSRDVIAGCCSRHLARLLHPMSRMTLYLRQSVCRRVL